MGRGLKGVGGVNTLCHVASPLDKRRPGGSSPGEVDEAEDVSLQTPLKGFLVVRSGLTLCAPKRVCFHMHVFGLLLFLVKVCSQCLFSLLSNLLFSLLSHRARKCCSMLLNVSQSPR